MNIKQAKNMLRGAGYKSHDHGVYIHPDTGHKLYSLTYADGKQNWQRWLEKGELPQPPKMVANVKGEWWQIRVMEGENGRYLSIDHLPHKLSVDEWWQMVEALNPFIHN